MPGPEFWETQAGRRFLEGTLPRLTDTLKLLADELKRANDLKEKEQSMVPFLPGHGRLKPSEERPPCDGNQMTYWGCKRCCCNDQLNCTASGCKHELHKPPHGGTAEEKKMWRQAFPDRAGDLKVEGHCSGGCCKEGTSSGPDGVDRESQQERFGQ